MADMKIYRVFGGIAILMAIAIAVTVMIDLEPKKKMILFRIQFLLIFCFILGAMSRYVWINLIVLLPNRHSNSRKLVYTHWIMYIVFAAFLGLAFFSFVIGRMLIGVEPYFINKLAFACLGLLILIFFNLLLLSVVFGLLRLCNFTIPNADKWKTIIATVLSLLLCIQGLTTAYKGPVFKRVTVPLSKLPPSFDGTTVVQLSDIHLGPLIGLDALERVVKMVSATKPDIVVITGDLVDSTVANLKKVVLPLKRLRSKYGSYFVTGNHEYYTGDTDAWLEELKQLGIQPLHNSHVVISNKVSPEDKLYIAGVDDPDANRMKYQNHGMKLSQALNGRSRRFPTVLLAHQPKAAQQALDKYQDIDLILSGHTHGGQFFPMNIPIYFFNPFFSGLYKYKETYVYVTSGTYFAAAPLRIGSQAEITVLSLTTTR
ncbi:transmembrane protein with metallophosphoesterase domain-like [Stylophora pistillata]|nr:transmembrane protein with metallophosphoesterase domain-like [Stylophora pistillata]